MTWLDRMARFYGLPLFVLFWVAFGFTSTILADTVRLVVTR